MSIDAASATPASTPADQARDLIVTTLLRHRFGYDEAQIAFLRGQHRAGRRDRWADAVSEAYALTAAGLQITPVSDVEGRAVTVKTEWRCKNVGKHMRTPGSKTAVLPTPCRDCYSVEVTERPISFDPASAAAWRRHIDLKPTAEEAAG